MITKTKRTAPPEATPERAAARARLDQVERDEQSLPGLNAAVEQAREALDEGTARLGATLAAAVETCTAVANGTGVRRIREESTLRASAPDLIAERGPVIQWLMAERDHVRQHTGEAEQHEIYFVQDVNAKRVGLRGEKDHLFFEDAQRRVRTASAAREILPTFEDALAEVRDLQLQLLPDPAAAVRAILKYLPARCYCGRAFKFDPASAD